ncbi:MAG: DegT/DnrJ/EryC1/StrS family aminotransferase [Luteimonas sp.]
MPELPPTNGLQLHWRDLLPARGALGLDVAMRRQFGIDDLQMTCSGTAALVIALRVLAARSSQRCEVVIPAYTCPLVARAVAHCGLQVRVCDLDVNGDGMDAAMLSSLCGAQTLAIVPTHLGGRIVDIAPALKHARACGAYVIEDAAQALGGHHADGTPAGLAGDIGFCSLAAGKGLTIYEGGLLFARDATLRALLRDAAAHALPRRIGWELRRSAELIGYTALYRPRALAVAYGWPLRRALRRGDFDAAAGDALPVTIPMHRVSAWRRNVAAHAMTRLPQHLSAGAARARVNIATLRAIDGIAVMEDSAGAQGVWPVLMVRMPDQNTRDAALAALWGAGLGVSVPFARALPDYPSLRGIVPETNVPNARDHAARVLTITNSAWLNPAAFTQVADALADAVHDVARPKSVRPLLNPTAPPTTAH